MSEPSTQSTMINPWVAIIAAYGIQFAYDLSKTIEDKTDPTPEDFLALITKYGTKTLAEKLAEYKATHPAT